MNANNLLTWLSAKGSGTWSRYRAAVDELQVSDYANGEDEDFHEDVPDSSSLPVHHRLKLNLERLGHAEFFRKDFKNGWRVVPPVLACVSNQPEVVGILCGARTDQLLALIEVASSDLHITATNQKECPDRISIIANDLRRLQSIAESVGLHFQPEAAKTLLAAAPPIDDLQLLKLAELPFGPDWEVKRFSSKTLGWVSTTADEARAASFGLFRFQMAFRPQYYLRLHRKEYTIPVQVGKYIVLRKHRCRVISYDDDKQTFSVPISCRPPLLVDRALTLCSGLIPRVEERLLKYRNVSKAIALKTAALLKE
jgi:hypothetical protein